MVKCYDYLLANETEVFTVERMSWLIERCQTVTRLNLHYLALGAYANKVGDGYQIDAEYVKLLDEGLEDCGSW